MIVYTTSTAIKNVIVVGIVDGYGLDIDMHHGN